MNINRRVVINDGLDLKFLGYGVYLGDVPVYFYYDPNGVIKSKRDAETPFTQAEIDAFEHWNIYYVNGEMNPKIRMDEGRIVYGCQVWWRFAEEGES